MSRKLTIERCSDCPFANLEVLGIFRWTECIFNCYFWIAPDGDPMRLVTETIDGWPSVRYPIPPPDKCPLRSGELMIRVGE